MADLDWECDGRRLAIFVAGRRWVLKLDEPRPCLSWSDGRSGARLFVLDHIAMAARRDDSAFGPHTLTGFERHRGRVEATYAPKDWHGLTVRAAWSKTPTAEGFDLEVQVSAATVGLLRRLEAVIASEWSDGVSAGSSVKADRLEPRDAVAAATSYDGRESPSTLQVLTTLPVPPGSPPTLIPRLVAVPGPQSDCYYAEMVRPSDCARRIIEEAVGRISDVPSSMSTRYGLFGHDLEKGVVLRGRLRGIWIRSIEPETEVMRRYEEFLREPPSLGP